MGVLAEPVYAPFVLPRQTPCLGMARMVSCGWRHPTAANDLQITCTRNRRRLDAMGPRSPVEQNRLFYSTLMIRHCERGNLRARFDTIIIPDQSAANHFLTATARYDAAGIHRRTGTRQASRRLREFVEQGGTLVCLNRASSFAIEQFKLPVRDVVAKVSEKEFFVPGSILRIELDYQ